jgi:signal transduction histidine kinase/DNA-binding response OmpR family regulator/CHASE3 domain sensor protein
LIRSAPRWFESLAVRGKLGAVIAVQLALLTGGSLAVIVALDRMSDARHWTEHTRQVLETVETIRSEAIEQQSSVRGYVITAQERFLDPYRSGVVEFETTSLRLRHLIQDNPAQLEHLARLTSLMSEWQTEVATQNIAHMNRPETRPLAVESVASGAGKRRIDAVKALCDEMSRVERSLLVQRAATVTQIEHVLLGLIVGLLVLGWITGLYAVALINRVLGEPLSRLTELVPRLITGEPVEVPHLDRRDEVGTLASAFERLRETSVEQRRADWVRQESSAIVGALQHADSDSSFGLTLLSRLCPALEAGYGLAYRWNEEAAVLEWCAAYGLPDEAAKRRRFRLGEGLVGQSMVERRVLRISPVPEGYLQIVSGLGAAAPGCVLFAPMTARGETVAVLEIGMLNQPTVSHTDLLDQLLVTTGLAWHSLTRGVRTRELLEQSRAMTEELRSRQESLHAASEQLRAANEALRGRGEQLEEQGRKLRVSEEELRAQTEELRITNTALEEKTVALRHRQDELEVARVDLERKAADLEQASRYKSEFLANMSHELRTPLNSMLILSKMLADNSEGNLDSEQVESARVMHESGRSLLSLINDILDLSKVEAGKMAVVLEAVNISDCLQALVDRFRPLAGERGLDFSMRMEPETPDTLQTDGARLVQILSNLLSNAFKFTHTGSIELVASPARVGGAPGVALCVSDTGIGIPADKLERVFQAFEQADSSTSRRYGGTGLGLSIVSGMTALLGGEVKVRSEQGRGSAFTIMLPIEPRAGAAASVPGMSMRVASAPSDAGGANDAPTLTLRSEPSMGPAGTPALLIVEDDAVFARVLADIAGRRGLEVLTVGTGREALRIARERRLFGVLLDIGLPDISGWDVLEQLKADPHTQAVPVHVISGGEEAERGRALGAVGFLHKPVEREAVLEALERVGAGAAPRRRRLLLVASDPESRASICTALAPQDATIVEAISGSQALELLLKEPFDGLVLDPDLPDLSDREFFSRAAAAGMRLPPVVIHSRRELSADETLRLREHAGSIVIQGARSSERLLDEVHLFLHALEQRPAAMPASTAAPAGSQAAAGSLAGKTVLVVDDDMRNVFALSKALRARGLNVVMAQDGHTALTQLEQRSNGDSASPIDVVLMDIMMPGMDGYETIRRIRAVEQWQRLPIIAVTAKAMKGDREKCLEAGANDYCPKPIDLEQLISLLQVWV